MDDNTQTPTPVVDDQAQGQTDLNATVPQTAPVQEQTQGQTEVKVDEPGVEETPTETTQDPDQQESFETDPDIATPAAE